MTEQIKRLQEIRDEYMSIAEESTKQAIHIQQKIEAIFSSTKLNEWKSRACVNPKPCNCVECTFEWIPTEFYCDFHEVS